MKAGTASLIVAGGVLAGIFAVVPAAAAAASQQPQHDQVSSQVHTASATDHASGSISCSGYHEYRRDDGPYTDAWAENCHVRQGYWYSVTICRSRDGSEYEIDGDTVGRGNWSFAGECDYGGNGRYDVLVDVYEQRA
ncbi:MAG: hypothetical protein DLM58_08005 [Pseudonocardiales bacterium]|nr:MAG: hypothetical protein DLM58_08005 [Pseudonocardiales bacterium]